jgi:very-short-patch-repair endonuclease
MNENKIIRLYVEENKSTHEIAERMSTYPNKIRRILGKHGISLKTHSQAQRVALEQGRAKHPTMGRKRTEEERLKISSSVCNYWDNMDDSERTRRVELARKRWNEMSPDKRDEICSAAIKAIQLAGKEGSKLEKFLVEALRKEGYKVDFHKKDLIPTQKLEIDMYLPGLQTIIEIDGPSHFLPIWGADKLAKQIRADEQKSGIILSKGYVIMRVKNLSDFISLKAKDSLLREVKSQLEKIEKNFPSRSERFIEIEL